MSKSSQDIAIDFERAIVQMQNDLRYLVKKGKVSKGFIAKQNRILKSLITYYHQTQEQIKSSRSLLVERQLIHSKHTKELTDRIIRFEAICIIHGIIDFPRFLAIPTLTLIHQAKELHKEGGFKTSEMLICFIDGLPPEKKAQLEGILYERIDSKLKQVLKKIKNNKPL
ncbi:hypothetical protein ACFSTE_05835 [Aquimarina hainanensis]|uniref:DUF892 family protein n=1 Tax=Aquimarina hainanensis TaxID=1578017 RepID=A0ABW5N5Z1_9FLAO